MEVCAHFSGRKLGFFRVIEWQDPSIRVKDYSGRISLDKTVNIEVGEVTDLLWDLGEAMTKSIDDQLQPI